MKHVTKEYTVYRVNGSDIHKSFSAVLEVPSYTKDEAVEAFTVSPVDATPSDSSLRIYAHEGKLYSKLGNYSQEEQYGQIGDYLTKRAKLDKHAMKEGIHPLVDFIFVGGDRYSLVTEPHYILKSTKSDKREILVMMENLLAPYVNRLRYTKPVTGQLEFNALGLDDIKKVFPELGISVKFEHQIEVHRPDMVRLPGLEINDLSFIYTKKK